MQSDVEIALVFEKKDIIFNIFYVIHIISCTKLYVLCANIKEAPWFLCYYYSITKEEYDFDNPEGYPVRIQGEWEFVIQIVPNIVDLFWMDWNYTKLGLNVYHGDPYYYDYYKSYDGKSIDLSKGSEENTSAYWLYEDVKVVGLNGQLVGYTILDRSSNTTKVIDENRVIQMASTGEIDKVSAVTNNAGKRYLRGHGIVLDQLPKVIQC